MLLRSSIRARSLLYLVIWDKCVVAAVTKKNAADAIDVLVDIAASVSRMTALDRMADKYPYNATGLARSQALPRRKPKLSWPPFTVMMVVAGAGDAKTDEANATAERCWLRDMVDWGTA